MKAAAQDRLARVALSRGVEPGNPRVAALVAQVGADGAWEALRRRAARGGADVAPRIAAVTPEADLEAARSLGIRFVIPGDEEWPVQLDDLGHGACVQGLGGAPLGLWVKGPLRLDQIESSVAVVGSRSATSYGVDQAARLAGRVTDSGSVVVSGAAFGIDRAAHSGALAASGPTVAVLACGVDRAYPSAHVQLLASVAATGAVVSEVPHGSTPTRVRFLSRNRVIAALASGTVVVEAARRSGALNTAHWAEQLSRVVMGLPGPVTSAASQGVHDLLRSGGAALVTGADDVMEMLGTRTAGEGDTGEGPRREWGVDGGLSTGQRQLLDALRPGEARSTAALARAAATPEQRAARELSRLAELGVVAWESQPVAGWRLRRTARHET